MKLRVAWGVAALLAGGAAQAQAQELTISGDRIVNVTAGGVPARLLVDPGSPSAPIFNPDFADRAGFRSGWIGAQARIGPVKVPGKTAVIRLDFGQGEGEEKRRVGWFNAPGPIPPSAPTT